MCNLGIGGNRLLYGATPASRGMYGHAGIERYRYDLLPIEGLTHAVFALGTNDLGHPGTGARRRRSLLPWTSTPPPPAPSRTRCTSRA